jgi:hypothetical protein
MTRFALPGSLRWTTLTCVAIVACLTGQTAIAQESTPGDSEITTQLPAADLPSMNEQGFLFELESTWTGSFDQIPTEAPVYRLDPNTYDQAGVEDLAAKLGIEGTVEDQGGGTFAVTGDGGNLFVTPGLEQYVSSAEIPEGDLPSDDQAIAYAREWLRQSQLLPADAGDATVVARVDDPARIVVSLAPIRPDSLLSAYPAITITMGPNAIVLEASFRWGNMSAGDTYALRPVGDAWTEVAERRSYVQADVPGDVAEPGSTVTGQATYDTVTISYTTSGIPGETQYLQPVYVFTGTLVIDGSDTSYTITSYVPALINSQQPVG